MPLANKEQRIRNVVVPHVNDATANPATYTALSFAQNGMHKAGSGRGRLHAVQSYEGLDSSEAGKRVGTP